VPATNTDHLTKLTKLKIDLEDKKHIYEEINQTLCLALPVLFDNRVKFYASTFQSFFHTETSFHSDCLGIMEKLDEICEDLSMATMTNETTQPTGSNKNRHKTSITNSNSNNTFQPTHDSIEEQEQNMQQKLQQQLNKLRLAGSTSSNGSTNGGSSSSNDDLNVKPRSNSLINSNNQQAAVVNNNSQQQQQKQRLPPPSSSSSSSASSSSSRESRPLKLPQPTYEIKQEKKIEDNNIQSIDSEQELEIINSNKLINSANNGKKIEFKLLFCLNLFLNFNILKVITKMVTLK
jgi:hypothetical protein